MVQGVNSFYLWQKSPGAYAQIVFFNGKGTLLKLSILLSFSLSVLAQQ